MKNSNKKETMKMAWAIAREIADKKGGKAKDYFSEGLKASWKIEKQKELGQMTSKTIVEKAVDSLMKAIFSPFFLLAKAYIELSKVFDSEKRVEVLGFHYFFFHRNGNSKCFHKGQRKECQG